jgi:hypothetical protein
MVLRRLTLRTSTTEELEKFYASLLSSGEVLETYDRENMVRFLKRDKRFDKKRDRRVRRYRNALTTAEQIQNLVDTRSISRSEAIRLHVGDNTAVKGNPAQALDRTLYRNLQRPKFD